MTTIEQQNQGTLIDLLVSTCCDGTVVMTPEKYENIQRILSRLRHDTLTEAMEALPKEQKWAHRDMFGREKLYDERCIYYNECLSDSRAALEKLREGK